MPKIRDRELTPFHCTTCGREIGWTAPGEAKRVSRRAAVYCETCKDAPANLTSRQEEVLTVAHTLRQAIGKAPTLQEIGEAMTPPLSRSRVQSLVGSIRLRGHEEALRIALYGLDKAAVPAPARPDTYRDSTAPVAASTPLDELVEAAAAPSWEDVRY